MRSGKPASVRPWASTVRIWPPSASAASAPESGSITTNSSPPSRAACAPSGSDREKTSATSLSKASPNSCPARSLISLKSSQSMTRRLRGTRRSWADASARSRSSSSPRRLRIPVSASVTALWRSRSRANAASSDVATCAARTAAVSRSVGSTRATSRWSPTSAPSSPAFARSGSQTIGRVTEASALTSST